MIAFSPDAGSLTAISTARYSFDELAEIYNAGRVDYIVPMPMNGRRMAEYIRAYDVDLERSIVAVNADGDPAALGMLSRRDQRAWITRLGVIPERRGRHVGQFVMEALMRAASDVNCVQLEVIEGNEPAYRLFVKMGFELTRRLVVLRRPPNAPTAQLVPLDGVLIEQMDEAACLEALIQRDQPISWLEEAESMRKVGTLTGLRVTLVDGSSGAVVFCRLPFQLSHVTLIAPPDADERLAMSLIAATHRTFPKYDTKLENLDAASRFVPIFSAMGYIESFHRIEMIKHIAP
ncbi:MAG: GNAT family N-acetyltransferase [Chloroflexota bacterium]|nr:GNAT family N-acetyltransferase [Chloroflexota bacterium]